MNDFPLLSNGPLGGWLAVAASLAAVGWWVYYYPQGKAAKGFVELQGHYRTLWEEHIALLKKWGKAEGELARIKAEHGITEANDRTRDEVATITPGP